MRTIIAAVDNSAAARPVLAMARAAATALDGRLDAVHVVEDGSETARACAEAAGVTLRVLAGDPVDQLTRAAAADGVAALVVGARGSPGGPRPAGHVALALADRAGRPVVVVPPEVRPAVELRRVLVAMEGGPGKARSLRRTIDLSTAAGLEIVVVHVDEEIPSFTDQVQHETTAYAREFLARHMAEVPPVRLELKLGDPAAEVLLAIEELRPDLVGVGWPPGGGSRGAVAREILSRSTVPVLLVAVT